MNLVSILVFRVGRVEDHAVTGWIYVKREKNNIIDNKRKRKKKPETKVS